MPNSITAATPSAAASRASATAALSDSRSTPGIERDRLAPAGAAGLGDEQRQHELAGAEVGLTNQAAQPCAGAQSAHARLWKGHRFQG